MNIQKILVTGEKFSINRRRFLFDALSEHFEDLQILSRPQEWYETTVPRMLIKGLYAVFLQSAKNANAAFQKNAKAFISKSKRAEQQIRKLDYKPDIIFHLFSTYSPLWHTFDIPYVTYLDYTLALAKQHWPAWSASASEKAYEDYLECEGLLYQKAKHIFCMSSLVKESLIRDYGKNSEEITVVGASSIFGSVDEGEKKFGTARILFNGSDFERKGGDLVLEAFQKVRQSIPHAKLAIIGKQLNVDIEGVENLGQVKGSALKNLFRETDLAIAPARCEPLGIFLLDAMTHGVPCLVSANDANGIAEFIDNGVDGIVIDRPTPDRLATSIIEALNNPSLLTSMSHAARYKMKTKLSWTTIANTMAKTISNLNKSRIYC